MLDFALFYSIAFLRYVTRLLLNDLWLTKLQTQIMISWQICTKRCCANTSAFLDIPTKFLSICNFFLKTARNISCQIFLCPAPSFLLSKISLIVSCSIGKNFENILVVLEVRPNNDTRPPRRWQPGSEGKWMPIYSRGEHFFGRY